MNMEYRKQLFFGEIIFLLRGSEGMLAAADQYCDDHPALDLAEYVVWISQHGLQARCCRVPGVKGFFHRRKLQRVTDDVNQALRDRGAYITRESSVAPDRLRELTEEINQFIAARQQVQKEEKKNDA